jgi:peptide/nickel transport system permease protein
MHLLRYCVMRVVQLPPVLVGITLVAFLLLRVMPGDPATLILGARGTEADIRELTHQLGLDRPIWQQYLGFLWDVANGSFGRSITYHQAADIAPSWRSSSRSRWPSSPRRARTVPPILASRRPSSS